MRIDSSIAGLFTTQRSSASLASLAKGSSSSAAAALGTAGSDTVTLSDAAKSAAAKPSVGYDSALRNKMIKDAEQDPQFAEQTTYEYAHDTLSMTGPFVNINTTPMTYSFTGEVVTPENLAAFKTEAASATAAKTAIYDSEKARGTPDFEILKKLYASTNAQSNDYLSKIGWVRDGAIS